MDKESSGSFLS
jgi:hypothetical protein